MDNLTAAERQYNKHQEHMKRYQQKNKDKIAQYMKERYHRIKLEQPEKYLKMLAGKKDKRDTLLLKAYSELESLD